MLAGQLEISPAVERCRKGESKVRLIKTLGLTAVAAIVATAFLGVSSASATFATTLCTENTADLSCPIDKRAGHGHFIASLVLLLNEFVTVECYALFLGSVVEQNEGPFRLGNPLEVLGNFTYICDEGCEVQESKLPSGTPDTAVEVLKTGSELARVTAEGEILVFCPSVIHCKHTWTGLEGHVLGAALAGNGHATFDDEPVAKLPVSQQPFSGLLCPNSMILDALFVSLVPLYIRS